MCSTAGSLVSTWTTPYGTLTVFTKNRERFLNGDIAEKFFGAVLEQARAAGYLSEDHFTVDGTLIEAWASHKSFKPKDEKPLPIGGCIKVKNPCLDDRSRCAALLRRAPVARQSSIDLGHLV
jgi:hypothetical protein